MPIALQRVLLTIFLTCLWSSSFLFIKLAVVEIPVITVVAVRVALAAFLMGMIMLWQRRHFPKGKEFWFHTTLFATLSSILPVLLFCYAEKSIDSAIAALINGTTPMFTALMAHRLTPSDRLDGQKTAGIGLSVGGMLCIFWPALQQGVNVTTIGMSAALLGAFCYALSHVYAKRYFSHHEPYVAPAAQLLTSSLILIPMALWLDRFYELAFPSLTAWIGVGGMAIFGTFIGFLVYYRLLAISGPTSLSMTACFFPVGGMLLGSLFLGEAITWTGVAAAGMILAGIALVNGLIPSKKHLKKHLVVNPE